jgi:hypothetical protein
MGEIASDAEQLPDVEEVSRGDRYGCISLILILRYRYHVPLTDRIRIHFSPDPHPH